MPTTDDTTTEQNDSSSELTTETAEDTDAPIEGEDALGDPGKKALDAMKAQRNAADKRARAAEARLAEFDAAEALKGKPAEEQALELARIQGRTEAAKAANARILRAELKAVATGKLADPSDAALFLDLDAFDVSEDGEIDSDAISDAIDELLTRKPHLAAGEARRFTGHADQGARGKSSQPAQVTQQELEAMSPEQVNEARRAGRLNKLLGTKS